ESRCATGLDVTLVLDPIWELLCMINFHARGRPLSTKPLTQGSVFGSMHVLWGHSCCMAPDGASDCVWSRQFLRNHSLAFPSPCPASDSSANRHSAFFTRTKKLLNLLAISTISQ